VLGQINGIVASYYNDILARAVIYGLVIALIMWRPAGLFSFKSR
jgi:urea transport system permease protein